MSQTTARPLAVVIVTHNSAGVIEGCLRSVVMATGPHLARLLVVDNASGDDTLAVVARTDPEAMVLSTGGNHGFAAGVNAGIEAAPGCDILVLNPDIRLRPGSVDALRSALVRSGAGIAVPRLLDADGNRQPSLRRRPTTMRALGEAVLGGHRAGRVPALGELVVDDRTYTRPGPVDWATGAAWLVSRDCIDTVGRLDERYFLYSEETEYMLRAGRAGFEVRYEPAATATHLGGEQGSSARLWALAATNRVRLRRERDGRLAALTMWFAVLLNELPRALLRRGPSGARHRHALRALLFPRRWPTPPGTEQGYLCFSAQDWWYHNRAHSDFQLMRTVARRRPVLVVNSIGMRMPVPGRSTQVLRRILRKLRSVAMLVRRPLPDLPNFHVMSPLPLPFYGSPWLRRVNAVLIRTQVRVVCALLRLGKPVIMVTIPTAWDVVRPMPRRSLVFNRSDRHSDFPESDRATIENLERDLLRHADRVLYVSHALLDEERELTGERAHFLDHGVDLEHFRAGTEPPAELRGIPGPRIGFFGALDDYLVDFDLLERIAAELPEAALVLIGDSTHPMERFEKYPNVHWLGFRPYETIPAYGSGFDVAIMPWLNNSWIRHSNPIKLKEYLALGLPVVSTEFAELSGYRDRVRSATGHAEFVEAVRDSLATGGPATPEQLRTSVLPFSWTSRAAELTTLAESPE
ncbi:glycosyltransferase [Amycolatopsis cihanbeyliensis]|uniref:GT2 family glycosyltransferase n=1 Tax=Amycolatopsis cihanbeyliensis TaxID=1128664 RepID=A0A542DFJ3_AMYCI|nr:glycosyltransferase [Amycolatopsis cihanbeyliensis]TQJ01842.1 GT2 family glycosyltransferase [Amycolatopsis cihanbeyliensis]